MAIDYTFPVVLLFMFLDLIFIVKPKVPILNLFLGLFSVGITLTTWGILPLTPWISLLMIVLTVFVELTGIKSFMGNGKNK